MDDALVSAISLLNLNFNYFNKNLVVTKKLDYFRKTLSNVMNPSMCYLMLEGSFVL